MLEEDNAENELSSFFKAYWSPVDQYTHLPPRLSEWARRKKLPFVDDLVLYINNSLHLARKYARIFVRGHYLFRVANSFPTQARVFRERSSRKTVRYSEQIMSKDKYPSIFSPQMEAIVFIIFQIFFGNARNFENWGISSDIPQFQLGNILPRDAFRPIARERKYLMDYKGCYSSPLNFLRFLLV